ncbi:hypothetical protein L0128_06950, partial [candidate division KSB1 bacterium]|nr:hypothetical protein [candidate division KSB1 bacterium]
MLNWRQRRGWLRMVGFGLMGLIFVTCGKQADKKYVVKVGSQAGIDQSMLLQRFQASNNFRQT